MPIAPGLMGTPSGYFIAPLSGLSIGIDIAAIGAATPTSVAHGTNNLARVYPFYVPEPIIVLSAYSFNGATAAGNVDIGIYSEALALLVSTGAVAQAGTNALQEYALTDTTIPRGRYYAAISCSLSTATFFSNAYNLHFGKLQGLAQMATAHVLPSTLVPAAVSSAIQPVFGFSIRTLVA